MASNYVFTRKSAPGLKTSDANCAKTRPAGQSVRLLLSVDHAEASTINRERDPISPCWAVQFSVLAFPSGGFRRTRTPRCERERSGLAANLRRPWTCSSRLPTTEFRKDMRPHQPVRVKEQNLKIRIDNQEAKSIRKPTRHGSAAMRARVLSRLPPSSTLQCLSS